MHAGRVEVRHRERVGFWVAFRASGHGSVRPSWSFRTSWKSVLLSVTSPSWI